MHAEILNLVQRYRLILRRAFIWWRVPLWISPKRTNLNFTCRTSSYWVDDHRQKRLLVSLISHLRLNIDTTQPTSITRMGMIPSAYMLFLSNPFAIFCKGYHSH